MRVVAVTALLCVVAGCGGSEMTMKERLLRDLREGVSLVDTLVGDVGEAPKPEHSDCVDRNLVKLVSVCEKLEGEPMPVTGKGRNRVGDETAGIASFQHVGLLMPESGRMCWPYRGGSPHGFVRKRSKKRIDIVHKELLMWLGLLERTPTTDARYAETLRDVSGAWFTLAGFLDCMDLDYRYDRRLADRRSTRPTKSSAQKVMDRFADDYRTKALRTLEELRRTHPEHPKLDRVLFEMAYSLDLSAAYAADRYDGSTVSTDLGIRAQELYQELLLAHPESEFLPLVWLAHAEKLLFDAGNPEGAEVFVRKVMDTTEEGDPARPYAAYLAAWCAYERGDHQGALEGLLAAKRHHEKRPSDEFADTVAAHACVDLALPYAQLRDPADASTYFGDVCPDWRDRMLGALVETYVALGRCDDANAALDQLKALTCTEQASE